MSKLITLPDGTKISVIASEPDGECEMCHKTDELRPYGPMGERVCYECAMKNPEAAKRQMDRVLFGEDVQ